MLISRMFSSLPSRLLNASFPPSVLPFLSLVSPPSHPLGLSYDVTPQEALPIPHPIQTGSMLPSLGFPYLKHPSEQPWSHGGGHYYFSSARPSSPQLIWEHQEGTDRSDPTAVPSSEPAGAGAQVQRMQKRVSGRPGASGGVMSWETCRGKGPRLPVAT